MNSNIEWVGKDITSEEKFKCLANIPLELRIRANHLSQIYGVSYITINKDKTYSLYYYDSFKKELIEDK